MGANATKTVVFDSVEILSQTKARAEGRVKFIRALADDNEVSAQGMRNLRHLYGEARADVNAGLDRLLIELEANRSEPSVEPYARVAERASRRVQEFMTVSDHLALGKERSGVVEAGIKTAGDLVKAMVDVWKTLRGDRTAERQRVIHRIDSLKWAQFDEIK